MEGLIAKWNRIISSKYFSYSIVAIKIFVFVAVPIYLFQKDRDEIKEQTNEYAESIAKAYINTYFGDTIRDYLYRIECVESKNKNDKFIQLFLCQMPTPCSLAFFVENDKWSGVQVQSDALEYMVYQTCPMLISDPMRKAWIRDRSAAFGATQ